MMDFTQDERNMMMLYSPGTRSGLCEKQAFLSAIALLAYSYFLFLLSILGMKKAVHF